MNNEKRVRYTKSPLLEVIFQLRFPTILTISATAPTAFQEHLRTEFPFYREEIEQQNEVTIDINGNSSTIKRRQIKNHTFLSTDKRWKVNLTSSFLAISTTAYTQWEDFTKRCFDIVDKFEEVYVPSFYTRVGLRYVDAITKSTYGLQEKKWIDLVQPQVAGALSGEIEGGVKNYLMEAEYMMPNGTFTKSHFELVHINENPETSLLIDCDFFHIEMTPTDQATTVAEILHSNSSNFIRKSITPLLHEAMEPVEI